MRKRSLANKKAIDLGYGYGNYSIWLAQLGMSVTAVDYINPSILSNRIKNSFFSYEIEIIEEDLNYFVPKENYDLVVSRNVLHFIEKEKLFNLFRNLKNATNEGGVNYFTIFTDIVRLSNDKSQIYIENEAKLTFNYLINCIKNIYINWKVNFEIEDYREKSKNGEFYYFEAKKVTLIIENEGI